MRKSLNILILTFFLSSTIYGQADSLWLSPKWESLTAYQQIDTLKSCMYAIIKTDKNAAEAYLNEAKELRNTLTDSALILQVTLMEGVYYRMNQEWDTALPFFFDYRDFFMARNDSIHLQDVYWQLGDTYFMKEDYDTAIKYLLASYDHTLTSQEVRWAVVSRLRIIYDQIGYYNLGQEIFMKHAHQFPPNQTPVAQCLHKMNLADYFINLGRLDTAETVTREFLKMSEEGGYKTLIHRANLNLQTISYLRNGTLDESTIRTIERFFDRQRINYRGYSFSKMYLAMILFEQGNRKEAYALMQKAYDAIIPHQDYRVIDIILKAWMALLERGNQINQLNQVLKYQSVNQDSIQSRIKNEKILALQRKYETEKKEEQIRQLNYQAELNQLALKKSNQQRLFFILAAFGLLAIAILIFRQFHIKRKSEALLAEKNVIISSALADKELLLKEIHHRVKNNLQVVSSLLGLQSEYIKDDNALTAINEGRNRVRSMALIHQNLYSEENLTDVNVKTYLETLIMGLFDTYNINEEKTQLQLEIQDIDLDVDTVVPLGLIANELVSNALKHAFTDQDEGIIQVKLTEQNDVLEFLVSDNGKGMDTSILIEDMPSFGYQMISAFKDKLNADLTIDGSNGTTIKMHISNYQKH